MLPIPDPETMEHRDALEATEDGRIELRAATLAETDEPGYDAYITTWWTVDDRGTFFIPGSFKKTMKERGAEAPVLFGHDFYSRVPVGFHDMSASGEDDKGVHIRALVNEEVPDGANVMSTLRFAKKHGKRGLGKSFGFDTIRQRSARKADPLDFSVAPEWTKAVPREELMGKEEVRFWESSILIFGANGKAGPTKVRARSAEELRALIAAVKDGTLEPDQRAALADLVDAWTAQGTPGPDRTTPPVDDDQVRRRTRELQYALLDCAPDLLPAGG